ncbi:MAG: signal peptide peptidase SppA [Bacteroidales bacterium]|nr:signal peptide peptidase SppA [Bacteroidales bacterium]
MKEFVKTVLAVICGLFLMQVIGFILFFAVVGSMAALGGKGTPVLPRNGVLDLDMSAFILGEQSREGTPDLRSFSMEATPTIGIWEAVQALEKAAADPAVRYVFLRSDGLSAGMAQLQEMRAALGRFRESGKAVVAFTENPSNGSYYLASVADKVYMTSAHGGQTMLVGLSGRLLFLKDLLDRLGINYQLIRHGKYKSAGEMYIKSSPSPENLEQNRAMLDAVWTSFSGAMAESRGIQADDLDALIDNLSFNFPEDFLEHGLVDSLVDREQLVRKLCDLAVVDRQEDLHLVPFADYVAAKVPENAFAKTQVAILYADGTIVDDSDSDNDIVADRFVRTIDKVRKDNSVKAVVLRVNSPGGSVLASSKIRAALDLLREEKPLVASYGNYAASGGYWISSGCRKVYADAATLTGSIGVFSMIPEFSKTAKDLAHVNVVTIGTHKHSDMFSLMRPFDAAETAYMQASVEDIYNQFVTLVSEGRGMTPERVDEIAQGRVWAGSDALGIGLVDEIGTLRDAVSFAASEAGLFSGDDYAVVGYPKPKSTWEQLLAMFGQGTDEESILSGTPFAGMATALRSLRQGAPTQVYAQMPYTIDIR